MKKIRLLKNFFLCIYPYLYMIGTICTILFINGMNNEESLDVLFKPYLISIIIFSILFTLLGYGFSIFGAFFYSFNKERYKEAIFDLMKIKMIQIPAYIITFIVGLIGFVMSIWGIGFFLLAVTIDFLTITMTGTLGIGSSIALYRNDKVSKIKAFVLALLGYIYVIDVISSFIVNIKYNSKN